MIILGGYLQHSDLIRRRGVQGCIRSCHSGPVAQNDKVRWPLIHSPFGQSSLRSRLFHELIGRASSYDTRRMTTLYGDATHPAWSSGTTLPCPKAGGAGGGCSGFRMVRGTLHGSQIGIQRVIYTVRSSVVDAESGAARKWAVTR